VYQFIFNEIYKKLGEALAAQVEALSWGQPESFEQYAEMVGKIAGIRRSIEDVHEVQDMLQKQEEDDN
jgi:hypothetical protein